MKPLSKYEIKAKRLKTEKILSLTGADKCQVCQKPSEHLGTEEYGKCIYTKCVNKDCNEVGKIVEHQIFSLRDV